MGNIASGIRHPIPTRSVYNIRLWRLGERGFNGLKKCCVYKIMIELITVILVYNFMLILFVSASLPQVPSEKLLEVPG